MTYTATQIKNAKTNYFNMLVRKTIADYDIEIIGTNEAYKRMETHNNIVNEINGGNTELEREWKLFFLTEEVKKDQKLNASKNKKAANKKASAPELTKIKANGRKLGDFYKWLNTKGNPYRNQYFSKGYTMTAVDTFLAI